MNLKSFITRRDLMQGNLKIKFLQSYFQRMCLFSLSFTCVISNTWLIRISASSVVPCRGNSFLLKPSVDISSLISRSIQPQKRMTDLQRVELQRTWLLLTLFKCSDCNFRIQQKAVPGHQLRDGESVNSPCLLLAVAWDVADPSRSDQSNKCQTGIQFA